MVKNMAKYLTGKPLSKAIRKVMLGKNPKLCVAFLGPNWREDVFPKGVPKNLKIICDLEMRATVQSALEAAGAPKNANLKYFPGKEMHAKIYMSDDGAVVCSANASTRAFADPNRIEDGILISPKSSAFHAVLKEFENRFEEADQVDEEALLCAPKRVNRHLGSVEGLSLIEAIKKSPSSFDGVGFAFTRDTVDDDVVKVVKKMMNEEEGGDEGQGSENAQLSFYSDWKMPKENWPALFFSIHLGQRGGVYIAKQAYYRFLENVKVPGNKKKKVKKVLVARNLKWSAVGRDFGGVPKLAAAAECLEELKQLILKTDTFEKCFVDDEVFSAFQLKELLEKHET